MTSNTTAKVLICECEYKIKKSIICEIEIEGKKYKYKCRKCDKLILQGVNNV